MKISDLLNLPDIFTLCETGAKIPWNEPEFSRRMLQNHLSQAHDWASRPDHIIRQHTGWIAGQLHDPKSRILDLACGPGLYTHLLAQAGFSCVGVDFAPAAMEYARQRAENSGLALEYALADVRDYEPKGVFDLVMMVFGEFNEFSLKDAEGLLLKAANCLKPCGCLLLEMQTPDAIEVQGLEPQEWQALNDDYLTVGPYLCLTEYAWDELNARAATRWVVVREDGAVETFAACTQSYPEVEFKQLLAAAGFNRVQKVAPKAWPTGESFTGQLETYLCYKQS